MRKGTWKHGITGYQNYKCRCDICAGAAKAIRARYRPVTDNVDLRLPGEPLIERLDRDERWYDRNVGARLLRNGLTVYAADRWAIRFGYHPYEIWGEAFYEGCNNEPVISV